MENVEIVANGELFVKNHPDIVNASKSLSGFNDTIELSQKMRPYFMGQYSVLDYSGIDDFYQLTINGKKITLKSLSEISKIYSYDDLGKLKKDFTSLREVLDKATFVGQYFCRTEPVIQDSGDEDRSFMLDSITPTSHTIVLYALQDLFIAKDVSRGKIILLESIYTLDGKYRFFGKVDEDYKDKNHLYQDILKQFSLDKGKSNKSK